MPSGSRRPIVPEDLIRLTGVVDPQISPDGRRVAFSVATVSTERDEYPVNVWIVDTAGGEPRRFTTGSPRDYAPRWSPDGRWLSFVSDRGARKKPQLYVMPSDGGEARALTDLPNGVAVDLGIAWSPDSTRLAFVSRVGGWHEPERDEDRRTSKPARIITSLKYRYEGLGFTYDRPPHLFVVAISGEPPKQITFGGGGDAFPTWSSDGTRIAFAAERHVTRDLDSDDAIYLVSSDATPDSGEPERVSPLRHMWHPTFSPDGREIAHAGMLVAEDGYNFHVFVQPLDAAPTRCLTETLDRSASELARPAWTPDGEWIVFLGRDRGTYPLYRVRAKGGDLPETIVGGRRGVTGFSVAADTGTVAFTASDPVNLAELFVCNADGSGERQLTDLNRAFKAEVELSSPEPFTFHRARYDIHGWVMKPAGFDPAKRYPGQLWIHGGPHREYTELFWLEGQIEAGAGYAVIYMNPRASRESLSGMTARSHGAAGQRRNGSAAPLPANPRRIRRGPGPSRRSRGRSRRSDPAQPSRRRCDRRAHRRRRFRQPLHCGPAP